MGGHLGYVVPPSTNEAREMYYHFGVLKAIELNIMWYNGFLVF